jgi:hypothetical protein
MFVHKKSKCGRVGHNFSGARTRKYCTDNSDDNTNIKMKLIPISHLSPRLSASNVGMPALTSIDALNTQRPAAQTMATIGPKTMK